ncbi:MAG: hypothetical protein EP329_08410 [Deltaproteobacteria bacterium]|nr:MAG: hypothetical protein EP329_08410 [Deltaproteobacteria bacterium]
MRRLLLTLLLLPLAAPAAHAESWCAYPLWVHEWGVHVFASDGQPAAVALPEYFHTPSAPTQPDPSGAVRNLPADSGVRALPVLHFYSAGSLSSPIPVGVEVGFTHGAASAWYPAVDRVRPAAEANGAEARAVRAKVEALRQERVKIGGFGGGRPAVPLDPTRQLVWDRIDLTPTPARKPAVPVGADWVYGARDFSSLWANTASESERFVFYEAGTREQVPLKLVRGDTWAKGRRHYVLHNTGAFPVDDVFVVTREGGQTYVFYAPAIPAGKSAGFLVEDHRVKDVKAATRDRLRAVLVDPAHPDVPAEYRWDDGSCTMMRDPAIPVEEAAGHKLFGPEADLVLKLWGDRFFGQQGTTIVYREDVKALDAAMPLSIYTDMYNFVVLHRAGLAVWEHVKLP